MHDGRTFTELFSDSVSVSYRFQEREDVAQLVRASDHHAADAGSIPLCGKGFFSQSQLSVQTLLRVSVHPPPCPIACINICAHVKDPVVHVRVQWIRDQHPAYTIGWVARLCCNWLSPGKATQISHGRNPVGTVQLTQVLTSI